MPLVSFVYNHTLEAGLSTPLPVDNFVMKVRLPFEARSANWRLKRVVAASWNDFLEGPDRHARWIEVSIPELMTEDRLFYSLNTTGVVTPTPNRAFRFYMNQYQTDSRDDISPISSLVTTSASPNYNLGYHKIDKEEITLIISSINGRDPRVKENLSQFSVILEYD
jgi:hypothetical protein